MNIHAAICRDDLLVVPRDEDRIVFPAEFGTRFLLTIDTEGEFDWDAPFEPGCRPVTILDEMQEGQRFFVGAGIRPLMAADYSVIDDPRAGPMLAGWAGDGTVDVGAHLHPWSNPPYVEAMSERNSFVGNLPADVERAKLTLLRDRIAEVIGQAPIVYRAGRYGVGPNTAALLCDLGFRIDSSVRSGFDYSGRHGPDFSRLSFDPYRVGPDGCLTELPLSTAFTGGLRRWGGRMVPVLERQGVVAGALARSGLLQRIPLTPEGVKPEEAILAIDRLLAAGSRLLLFSFHSPTLALGHTPYVRDAADLRAFYQWWDRVLDHLARRGVAPAALGDILAACDRTNGSAGK